MANIENLDQIRAKNAFEACQKDCFKGKNGGEVVKKLPPMIRENGMLGALAFALDKKEKKAIGYSGAFDAIAQHLNNVGKTQAVNAEKLQMELLGCTSLKLRDVTVEAMFYLDYLRRYASTEKDSTNEK